VRRVADVDGSSAPPKHRSRRERARLMLAIGFTVVATVFVLSNTQRVTIHWVVGTTDAPLIIALGVALLLGAGLGALAARRGRAGGPEPPAR
jgi:uncharacterized integral membrane protein